MIASGSEGGSINLVGSGETEPFRTYSGQDDSISDLTFNARGDQLLSTATFGNAWLWRLDRQDVVQKFGPSGGSLHIPVFDLDDTVVFVSADEGQQNRWRIDPFLFASPAEQVELACTRLEPLGFTGFSTKDRARFPILKGEAFQPCTDRPHSY